MITLASGLWGHFYLFNELKVDKLIGIENILKIGDPRLTLEESSARSGAEIQSSGAKLEYLGHWSEFPVGVASIDIEREPTLKNKIVSRWKEHKRQGILLVVRSNGSATTQEGVFQTVRRERGACESASRKHQRVLQAD